MNLRVNVQSHLTITKAENLGGFLRYSKVWKKFLIARIICMGAGYKFPDVRFLTARFPV